MLNAADDPKAEEARRLAEKKRNAYFAELFVFIRFLTDTFLRVNFFVCL